MKPLACVGHMTAAAPEKGSPIQCLYFAICTPGCFPSDGYSSGKTVRRVWSQPLIKRSLSAVIIAPSGRGLLNNQSTRSFTPTTSCGIPLQMLHSKKENSRNIEIPQPSH
ncbi:hypothetical protein VOLCADRAFT_85098, partial [Volvox carteri f. nagariensis]